MNDILVILIFNKNISLRLSPHMNVGLFFKHSYTFDEMYTYKIAPKNIKDKMQNNRFFTLNRKTFN